MTRLLLIIFSKKFITSIVSIIDIFFSLASKIIEKFVNERCPERIDSGEREIGFIYARSCTFTLSKIHRMTLDRNVIETRAFKRLFEDPARTFRSIPTCRTRSHTHVRGIVNTGDSATFSRRREEVVNVPACGRRRGRRGPRRGARRERTSQLMVMVSSQCLASRAQGRYTHSPLRGSRALVSVVSFLVVFGWKKRRTDFKKRKKNGKISKSFTLQFSSCSEIHDSVLNYLSERFEIISHSM